MRKIEVTWVDSVAAGGWKSRARHVEENTYKCLFHTSVGYLLTRNSKLLLIAQSKSSTIDSVADTIAIPVKAVIKIKTLK